MRQVAANALEQQRFVPVLLRRECLDTADEVGVLGVRLPQPVGRLDKIVVAAAAGRGVGCRVKDLKR